jgi:hypothetical protein
VIVGPARQRGGAVRWASCGGGGWAAPVATGAIGRLCIIILCAHQIDRLQFAETAFGRKRHCGALQNSPARGPQAPP